MTDSIPSKDVVAILREAARFSFPNERQMRESTDWQAADEIVRLREDCRRWENAHKIWLADNERLRAQVAELSIHAEKWVKRATTPVHEREPPHCSNCSCGMTVHAPFTDAEIDAIANDGHRNAAGGIYATSVYEFARAIESAHGAPAQPPSGEPQ